MDDSTTGAPDDDGRAVSGGTGTGAVADAATSTPLTTTTTTTDDNHHHDNDDDHNDDDTRSCFICLQTAAETPGAAWVTPCPCTLEAHEACLLRWIAETDNNAGGGGGGSRKTAIRCPACNSRIRTEEPWDPVVALGDRWTEVYRRASPFVLLSTVLSMALAGSSFYGFQSLVQVAGEAATYDWFFWAARRAAAAASGASGAPGPYDRWRDAASLFRKVLLLNLVAPGLLLHRALPSVTNLLALPVSAVYGLHLVAHKRYPSVRSPAWALVLAPLASAAYQSTYYSLFGALERRLNLALRGRPSEVAEPAAEPGDPGDPGDGPLQRLLRNGLLNTLLRPEENMLIENAGAAAGFGVGAGAGGAGGAGGELAIQLEINIAEEVVGDEGGDDDEEVGDGDEEVGNNAIDPPPDIRRRRDDAVGPPPPPPPAAETSLLVSDIVAAMAAQLLLPNIASVMGRVLELTLPRAWVRPPDPRPSPSSASNFWGYRGRTAAAGTAKPTGLLQERWGRSLVGGCLYVVLRDGWNLYTKYRRVQVKRQRRIKNVDRKRGR